MIGQISGARRRRERTLPRRPGKQPRRCASAPVAPDCELPPAAWAAPSPRSRRLAVALGRRGPPLRESRGGRPVQMTTRPSPGPLSCAGRLTSLLLLLSFVELAVKGSGWPSGGSGHSCQSGWSGTVAPESWGRGPCPISRAPGATADLVRDRPVRVGGVQAAGSGCAPTETVISSPWLRLDASGSGPSRGPRCTGSLCPWGLELCWGLELLPAPSPSS